MSSIIHFKRDIHKINIHKINIHKINIHKINIHKINIHNKIINTTIPRSFIIWSLFCISFYYNHDLLYYYMTFAHVPNHYITNFYYLKKTPILSSIILIITTMIIAFLNTTFLNINKQCMLNNPLTHAFIKAIIVSHVIYQEMFIHNK